MCQQFDTFPINFVFKKSTLKKATLPLAKQMILVPPGVRCVATARAPQDIPSAWGAQESITLVDLGRTAPTTLSS